MGYFCVSLYSLKLIIKNNKVASLMSRYRRQTVVYKSYKTDTYVILNEVQRPEFMQFL
jgi:hypothetical protein